MKKRDCYSCNKEGHVNRMGYKARHMEKKKKESKFYKGKCHHKGKSKVHYTKHDESTSSDSSTDSKSSDDLEIQMIGSVSDSKTDFKIKCQISGVDLSMHIDTCADLSVIPFSTVKSKLAHCEILPLHTPLFTLVAPILIELDKY
jgi:hypothetical protein